MLDSEREQTCLPVGSVRAPPWARPSAPSPPHRLPKISLHHQDRHVVEHSHTAACEEEVLQESRTALVRGSILVGRRADRSSHVHRCRDSITTTSKQSRGSANFWRRSSQEATPPYKAHTTQVCARIGHKSIKHLWHHHHHHNNIPVYRQIDYHHLRVSIRARLCTRR